MVLQEENLSKLEEPMKEYQETHSVIARTILVGMNNRCQEQTLVKALA